MLTYCSFLGADGIGAGNNWGSGYEQGRSFREETMDILTREAENSDSLEVGAILCSDI